MSTRQFAVYGPVTLAQLRWLVAQCAGCDDDSRVEVTGRVAGDCVPTVECINVYARPTGGDGGGTEPR